MPNDAQQAWEEYRAQELATLAPILAGLGYELDAEQPHTGGERYLMQAVTTASGKKLVLLGTRTHDKQRVVIKATSDAQGAEELRKEREAREILRAINFAYQTFLAPEEIYAAKHGGQHVAIYQFIEQQSTFLARPLREQFDLALSAFKAQEGAHATTYGHQRLIARAFETMDAAHYEANFRGFAENIQNGLDDERLAATLSKTQAFLEEHRETIEQYGGFLTHIDFVPHNFRIAGKDIYLLDHSSIRFGNKYEGWARFVNFMALYNPALAAALIEYVRLNRTPEESLALRLMRIYRLSEIIWYYVRLLKETTGNQYALSLARVRFWSQMLEAILDGRELDPIIIETYRSTRDSLRTPEELRRQRDLH